MTYQVKQHASFPAGLNQHRIAVAPLKRHLFTAAWAHCRPVTPAMPTPRDRRSALDSARRFLMESVTETDDPVDDIPRLTHRALEQFRMSRSRDRILGNLDEMYREAFERAKISGESAQLATLDFAYRREQLYFEILLDIRDAMERREPAR